MYDSVSSTKSFVEETIFSTRSYDDGGENVDGILWRVAEAKEGCKDRSLLETKRKHLEECFQSEMACQQRGGSSLSNKVMCEQVLSDDGAALTVTQQVNPTCLFIQNSLVNLAEGV